MSSSFAERLLLLNRYRRTGVMEVKAHSVCTFVYLQQGVPVFAEEGGLQETFGRVLLSQGLLDQEQYARVIQRMTDEVVGSEPMRFGEVAVALGFVNLEQINHALAEQVRQRVLHCFQWSEVECDFKPIVEALEEVAHYPLDVAPLVLEGVKKFYDHERVGAVLAPFRSTYPTVHGEASTLGGRFKMKPTEVQFLKGLDGRMTLDRHLATASLDPLHGSQLLATLILSDAIDLATDRQVNSMEMRAANVERVAVRSKLLSPNRSPPEEPAPLPVVDVAPRAEPPQRPGPSRRPSIPPSVKIKRARLQAEAKFQRGKRALEQNHLGRAVEHLRAASELYPQAIEYELYARWAQLLVTKVPSQEHELREILTRLYRDALKQDTEMAFAHYVRAHLDLAAGDEEKARRAFRRAHRLDPGMLDAERHLRVLASRRKPR